MIYDSHVHVGKYYNWYTSPAELVEFMQQANVKRYAVMSTTIWDEKYDDVISEFHELTELSNGTIAPILWLTPKMLLRNKLNIFLNSNISWKAIKVHGNHPWSLNGINECANIADELELPLILHTGDFPQCNPTLYQNIIKQHPKTKFVLAHCRPISSAIHVLKQCTNCYGDTAFTPIDDVELLIKEGLEDRILYGSDYPIHKKYFAEENLLKLYCENITFIKSRMTDKQWAKISHLNFEKLYD